MVGSPREEAYRKTTALVVFRRVLAGWKDLACFSAALFVKSLFPKARQTTFERLRTQDGAELIRSSNGWRAQDSSSSGSGSSDDLVVAYDRNNDRDPNPDGWMLLNEPVYSTRALEAAVQTITTMIGGIQRC